MSNAREYAVNQTVKWFLKGNTGLSSKAMISNILFERDEDVEKTTDHPHDPADLLRCIELLDMAEPIRRSLATMKKVSATWMNLVQNWEVLESTLKYELRTNGKDGKAPRTYELMKEIMKEDATEDFLKLNSEDYK